LLTGHYVSSSSSRSRSSITAAKIWWGKEGWGRESKMAVAAGVICLGGVEHSQRLPQSFNSCSAVAMPEVG